jgi:hypothetical protein
VRRRIDQFTIDLRRFARYRRPLTREAIRPWNPAADVRKRFRAANGTTLLIVNLLAVEAQARKAKLHALMINPLRTASIGV